MILSQSKISKEFLNVVNRDQLKTILSELALVQSGITENDYLELKKLSGADHILVASIITSHRPVEKISDKNKFMMSNSNVELVKNNIPEDKYNYSYWQN